MPECLMHAVVFTFFTNDQNLFLSGVSLIKMQLSEMNPWNCPPLLIRDENLQKNTQMEKNSPPVINDLG